jgi:hypothetical protein
MNTDRLVEVLGVQTASNDDFLMYDYLTHWCDERGIGYKVSNGNVYVTKGYSTRFPCIVAHMDTVHELVEDLTVVQIGHNLTGFNSVQMEQTGIGGDDKVGIFIALECLEKFDNIKAAFFRDEEIGCHGSYMADMKFFDDCAYVLQCDRQRNDDFITVASGVVLSSKKFQHDVQPIIKPYGYSLHKNGMMTDVMALKEIGVPLSMANIACGYYNPHCENEYVNIDDVENCLDMVQQIIVAFEGKYYQHNYEYKDISLKQLWNEPPTYSSTSYAGTLKESKLRQSHGQYECGCCLEPVKSVDGLRFLKEFNYWVCATCYAYYSKYDVPEKTTKKKQIWNDRMEGLW